MNTPFAFLTWTNQIEVLFHVVNDGTKVLDVVSLDDHKSKLDNLNT